MASLYETFPAAEARRIAKRLEFHHTPKHGSWLNMAEIEFSVLARACLRGRNGDEDSLERAVSACVSERNAIGATINWRFTAQDARRKLHRLYRLPILIWFSTSHLNPMTLVPKPMGSSPGIPLAAGRNDLFPEQPYRLHYLLVGRASQVSVTQPQQERNSRPAVTLQRWNSA